MAAVPGPPGAPRARGPPCPAPARSPSPPSSPVWRAVLLRPSTPSPRAARRWLPRVLLARSLGRPGLARGALAHAVVSTIWAVVLVAILPCSLGDHPRRVAGVGIAAVDLGVADRVVPAIAALPRAPQVADHVAFGVLVGAVIERTA